MEKAPDAFRTISEVAQELDVPQHVLRFWETRFPQVKPLKRAGGRRYYRPRDIEILRAIKHLLYGQGYTIKGVQRVLKEQGAGAFAAARDAANESRSEISFPTARELPLLPGLPPRQGEAAANSRVHSGMQPPAEPRASAGIPFSRAKRIAWATPAGSVGRTITAGRRSTIAFHTVRAGS